MITDIEYALFSANVYGNKSEITAPGDSVRTTRKSLPVPDGWVCGIKSSEATGYMAKAYIDCYSKISHTADIHRSRFTSELQFPG